MTETRHSPVWAARPGSSWLVRHYTLGLIVILAVSLAETGLIWSATGGTLVMFFGLISGVCTYWVGHRFLRWAWRARPEVRQFAGLPYLKKANKTHAKMMQSDLSGMANEVWGILAVASMETPNKFGPLAEQAVMAARSRPLPNAADEQVDSLMKLLKEMK